MGTYRGVDYLELERLLSDDEKLVRDSARDFVEREIEPIIVEAFREEKFPAHIIPKIAEMGFIGATLPEQYGGAGIGPVASGLIYQELERGDSGIRSYASVQSCLVMFPIFKVPARHVRFCNRILPNWRAFSMRFCAARASLSGYFRSMIG
jgi:glutaryl-CoA dehydrogenase